LGKGRNREVTRRLVIRPGAIGDFIVSLPAIESLRTDSFEVWATAQNLPLVRFGARTRGISGTGLDLLGITEPDAGLLDSLRSFDSIVSWYGSNRPDFRLLVAQLRLPFHFLPALPPPGTDLHACEFYLEQTAPFRTRQVSAIPRIPVPARQRTGAVIHPFSGSTRKNWPMDRYRALAEALRPMPVFWCAGPEDSLPNAVRIADLYDLACRLAEARVFIGNDSGIAHLAAAAGTPVVALFGPTDPRIWAPRGEGVRVVAADGDMASLAVADVLAAVASLIE
jgi:hypothetical protein